MSIKHHHFPQNVKVSSVPLGALTGTQSEAKTRNEDISRHAQKVVLLASVSDHSYFALSIKVKADQIARFQFSNAQDFKAHSRDFLSLISFGMIIRHIIQREPRGHIQIEEVDLLPFVILELPISVALIYIGLNFCHIRHFLSWLYGHILKGRTKSSDLVKIYFRICHGFPVGKPSLFLLEKDEVY